MNNNYDEIIDTFFKKYEILRFPKFDLIKALTRIGFVVCSSEFSNEKTLLACAIKSGKKMKVGISNTIPPIKSRIIEALILSSYIKSQVLEKETIFVAKIYESMDLEEDIMIMARSIIIPKDYLLYQLREVLKINITTKEDAENISYKAVVYLAEIFDVEEHVVFERIRDLVD